MLLLFGQVRESSRRDATTLTCRRVRVTSTRSWWWWWWRWGGAGRGAMAKAMMSPTFIAQLCILLATKTCVMHD